MILSKKSVEPPLHQAVLQNDIKLVTKFAQDAENLKEKNKLDLTAIELAQLLGKQDVLPILSSQHQDKIRVQLKDSTIIQELSVLEIKVALGFDFWGYLRFSDYRTLKDVIHHVPYLLRSHFTGCDPLRFGLYYPHLTPWTHLSIRWVDDLIGYGIFADKDIPEGTYIGEYAGHVHRISRIKRNTNSYCFHYPTKLWSLKYYVIDAEKTGNYSRFLNHSDTPNLVPFACVDRQLFHLCFLSRQEIKKDSQLTFDYGEDYWKTRKKIPL